MDQVYKLISIANLQNLGIFGEVLCNLLRQRNSLLQNIEDEFYYSHQYISSKYLTFKMSSVFLVFQHYLK